MLDIRTLLISAALSTGFCALARVGLVRLHPDIPGLRHWAWAGMLGAVALGLVAFRDDLSIHLSMSLPQILVALGLVLVWDGYRRFLGRQPLPYSVMAASILPAVFTAAISFIEEIKGLHSAGNAVVVAILSAAIAIELARYRHGSGSNNSLFVVTTAWIYGANASFFAIRAAVVFSTGQRPLLGTLAYDPFAAALLLWWLCITVAVTLCMVLMVGERLERELRHQANRDPLTGALNRRAFTLIGEKEVALAHRTMAPLSLLAFDLDHFKTVNDVLGHAVGDRVLCRFVEITQQVLRDQDVFCRFGGEEFVALLPGSTASDAEMVAERIRSGFARDPLLAAVGGGITFSTSIGAAQMGDGETIENLIRRADHALYRAKAAGRNRTELAPGPAAVAFAKAGL